MDVQVLLVIFSFLDDISLYAVGSVCRRWRQILTTNYFPARWREFTTRSSLIQSKDNSVLCFLRAPDPDSDLDPTHIL